MKISYTNFVIGAFGLTFLTGCAFGIPLKKSDLVTRQAERSATLRINESGVTEVRAALGEPLLQSRYWGVDIYQTSDLRKELAFFIFYTPPIPMGVFTSEVDGYIMITYDGNARVSNVTSGTTSKNIGGRDGLMLGADDFNFVIEEFGNRGPQLIVQSARLQDYLVKHHAVRECILVLACERPESPERRPNEACPDRVVIDAGEPLDPQPLFSTCEPAACPDTAVSGGGGYRHIPVLYPVTLPPGPHQLGLSSSVFKGSNLSAFSCDSGQVLYGSIHGNVTWHWWGPRSSTLTTSVSISSSPPSDWSSYSALLYRSDNWLLATDPKETTE